MFYYLFSRFFIALFLIVAGDVLKPVAAIYIIGETFSGEALEKSCFVEQMAL